MLKKFFLGLAIVGGLAGSAVGFVGILAYRADSTVASACSKVAEGEDVASLAISIPSFRDELVEISRHADRVCASGKAGPMEAMIDRTMPLLGFSFCAFSVDPCSKRVIGFARFYRSTPSD